MNLDVALEELIPHPADSVWAALTDGASISEWLMPAFDFRPEVGARFRMRTGRLSSDGWVDARVTALEPPRRMEWSWTVNDGAWSTTVTFELTPEGEGTRLRLTHTGEMDPEIGSLLAEGWPSRLELLRRSM